MALWHHHHHPHHRVPSLRLAPDLSLGADVGDSPPETHGRSHFVREEAQAVHEEHERLPR